MAVHAPLVMVDGREQKLQAADSIVINKLNLGPLTTVVINNGQITVPAGSCFLAVDTEGGASSDQLDDVLNETDFQFLVLVAANAGRTVTVADGGTGNRLFLPSNFNLAVESPMLLSAQFSFWYQLMRSTN